MARIWGRDRQCIAQGIFYIQNMLYIASQTLKQPFHPKK